jgi:hypothetical protein
MFRFRPNDDLAQLDLDDAAPIRRTRTQNGAATERKQLSSVVSARRTSVQSLLFTEPPAPRCRWRGLTDAARVV